MASMIHLDTNVIVWLYAGLVNQFSSKAKEILEDNPIAISPMVILELSYLTKIGRLRDRIGLIVDTAAQMQWTRDPFDRIIAAQAAVYQNILLTKDDTIRAHYPKAIW